MVVDSSSGPSGGTKPSTPFEWLSGGLFFGGKASAAAKQPDDEGGIDDSSKDVPGLVDGIHQNLDALLLRPLTGDISAVPPPSSSSTTTTPATTSTAAAATTEAHVQSPASTTDATDESTDPSQFLATRLSRIRGLLYEERRLSSAQHGDETIGSTRVTAAPQVPVPRLSRGGRKQSSSSSAPPAVALAAVQCLSASEPAHRRELFPRLLENLSALPFETRKHVAAIFNYLLVSGLEGSDADLYRPCMEAFREYVDSNFERFMEIIVRGHEQVPSSATPDVALHFGSMYRSCLRHANLYQRLVSTTDSVERFVFPFLDSYVHYSDFEVASDAMESVRVVFLAGGGQDGSGSSHHRTADDANSQQAMAAAAAEFMARDYDAVWNERYNPKLLSAQASYMTRRVALQILSAVLLTRSNYNVMIKYVDSRANLILIMDLLRDTSPHITLDAWQVFKVFVANPNKPGDVIKILRDNKVKLCRYLESLHRDREDTDAQFRDEKALIIATIEAL